MLNRFRILLVVTGFGLFSFACSTPVSEIEPIEQPAPTQASPTSTNSQPLRPSSMLPVTPTMTILPSTEPTYEIVTDDPSPLPSITATQAVNEMQTVSCQNLPGGDVYPLAGIGSVLYNTIGTSEIWAISLDNLTKRQLLSSLGSAPHGIQLSPDKTTVSFHPFLSTDMGQELVLYDLRTGAINLITWHPDWVLANPHWNEDGRIVFKTFDDQVLQFHLLDPLTLGVEEKKIPAGWPEVAYTSVHNFPGTGFISVDPTGTFALYTEWRAETNSGISFVLRNIQNGRDLWYTADIGYKYMVKPVWSQDGAQALVVLSKAGNRPETLILSLTPDGQETEIVRLKDLPGIGDDFAIRYLEWSADQRFIHFGLFTGEPKGPGYILDLDTDTIYEICEPNFVEGWWLPGEAGDYLLYLADREPEVEFGGKRTLNLLDVTTWQQQEILVVDTNFTRSNVIGWTPIETP